MSLEDNVVRFPNTYRETIRVLRQEAEESNDCIDSAYLVIKYDERQLIRVNKALCVAVIYGIAMTCLYFGG